MPIPVNQQSPASPPGAAAGRNPKARITVQARDHFLAHGFRSVTMDDLAAELGMSKKTLYAHFPGKGALLEAVVDDKLRSVDEDLRGIVAGAVTDFPMALQQLLACVRKHAEELKPPFVRDLARETPELFQTVQARRRALFHEHFGTLLADGRKDGMIRRDIPVELMVESLLGATEALMNPSKLSELGLTARECLSGVITLFLDGVVTEKGRKTS